MDKPADLRRVAAVCALLAALPLLPQLPGLMSALIIALLAMTFLFPKPPRLLIVGILLLCLALLLFAYRGRFGRDAAACMLALMMALKGLETAGLRDLRALLGFSLFLPFAALLSSQAPAVLALSVLNLLSWTLTLRLTSTGGLRWPAHGWLRTARNLGTQLAMALPLAIALFWLFPRISTPLWGLPGLSNQGSGLGDSMKPGQWLDTLVDDRIAFRVDFSGAVPAPAQRYWRGPVLWDFDGLQWRRNPQDSRPDPARTRPRDDGGPDRFAYTVSLEATEKKYLPVLDWPLAAPEGYYLSRENSLYAVRPVQKLTRYSARSVPAPRGAEILDAATRRRALAYPAGFNPRSQALAKDWRRQSADDRAYIARVLAWIRRDFSYTLATEAPRINAVDDFLFTDRKGFCQHFSSSFALLMRAAGIPTRIVTGYVGGYRNPYGGYWVLYNKDAHAWNEVWLDGEGWVRIDPTAAVAPENILDTLGSAGGQEQYAGERGAFSSLFDYGDFIRSRWDDWVVGFNAARQLELFKGIGLREARRWQMLAVLLAFAGLISYAVFALSRRVTVPLHPVESAWRKLLRKLERTGTAKAGHETALDFARRTGNGELAALAGRYTQWRYGKTAFGERELQALAADMAAFTRRTARTRMP